MYYVVIVENRNEKKKNTYWWNIFFKWYIKKNFWLDEPEDNSDRIN